jgi:hypothetical protein
MARRTQLARLCLKRREIILALVHYAYGSWAQSEGGQVISGFGDTRMVPSLSGGLGSTERVLY